MESPRTPSSATALGPETGSTRVTTTPRSDRVPTGVEKRSKNGCITCRVGRVKCDEVRPKCTPCTDRGYRCSWSKGIADNEALRAALRPRRRQLRACRRCKDRKIRCSGPGEHSQPCAGCIRAKQPCDWSAGPKTSTGGPCRSPTASVGRLERTAEPPTEAPWCELMDNQLAVTRLVKQYFDSIHQWGFHTFIHPPTFFRLLHKRKTPRMLTMIMTALVIRTNTTDYDWRLADAMADDVLAAHQSHIDSGFGAIELMVCLLLRCYQSCRGQHVSAWMLTGAALRMSQYLSLHIFDASYSLDAHPDINPLLKPESLRRLAWSVFYLDTMADAGVHGMHQTTDESFHIQLPCEETDFLRSSKVITPLLSDIMTDTRSLLDRDPGMRDSLKRLGLSAFIIRAAAMRRRILHFASKLRWSAPSIQRLVAQSDYLEEELKAMLDQVPDSLGYSNDNLYVHSTQQATFVLLHILQHNCCLMLARARLLISAIQPHSTPELAVVARKDRLQHAFACARVVSDALQLDVHCDDFVGTASYTCLEVLLFEPVRLAAEQDMQGSINKAQIVEGLQPLMAMIRKQAAWSTTLRQLRIEACRRLVRCGFQDLLTEADWKTTQENYRLAGPDDTEFSFWTNRWHWFQRNRHDGNAITPAAEALLDIRGSQPVSRSETPPSGAQATLEPSHSAATQQTGIVQSDESNVDMSNTIWQTSPGLELPIDWSTFSQAMGINNLPGGTPSLDFGQTRSWDVLDYRPEATSSTSGLGQIDQSGAETTLGRGLLGDGSTPDEMSSLFNSEVWQPFG